MIIKPPGTPEFDPFDPSQREIPSAIVQWRCVVTFTKPRWHYRPKKKRARITAEPVSSRVQ
ncbi:MAG TPA: hypothetical protein VMI06_19900 [Terriglobia bacterium]|nr:hypothetical protein [Terriglobia bacterium]